MLDRIKRRGKKEKESFYYIYDYYYISIYFFTSKPGTRSTKQVLPKLVAYLNNRVLLSKALSCNRLPEEI